MTTPVEHRRRPAVGTVLTGLAVAGLVVAGLAALVLFLVALGALVPGLGPVSSYATIAVPWLGPPLVVLGVVVTVLGLVAQRRARRAGAVVAAGAGVATVAIAVVVGIVVSAAVQAGGGVDLVRALAPSTTGSPTDARPVYTTGPDGVPLHLSVYDARNAAPGPVPVLVYVHGGGWSGGTDLASSADMRRFADGGRLVVSVEYTLATPQRPTWDVAGPQVACALAVVGALAATRGGDPSRIVLAGDSAGGQLAVSVGYRAASGTQPSSCGGAVPAPRGVLVQYPAVDLLDAYANGVYPGESSPDGARALGRTYFGGTPDRVGDRYRALSGAAALTPGSPPTLVLGPTRDDLVPPGGVSRFVEQARAAGVDAELVGVPFANHAYDVFGYGSLGNQVRRSVSEDWLERHGW